MADKAAADPRDDNPVPMRKLVMTLLAISFGTILEWYDYSIYTQLSKLLSKVFFPSHDPALQALSFWGVYAVGFLSRPAGAVLFGHLGDTKGRGFCLLLSVLVMGVPTVLIGCLPTYDQAGYASPVLLAVLRLVQGLAMGGEFGAAMVYLYELAHSKHKGVTGSVGYISLGSGVVLGILVVNAVISLVPSEADLLVWGWRVPFLVASVSLAAGVILRYNMPESMEFKANHDDLDSDYHKRLRQQQAKQRRHHMWQQSAAAAAAEPNLMSPVVGKDPPAAPAEAAAAAAPPPPPPQAQQRDSAGGSERTEECWAEEAGFGSEAGCSDEINRQHYVPLLELFRGYWSGLVLHVAYAAWNAAAFHLGYSWLPSFFVQQVGISTRLSLWMLLTCMVVFTLVVPISGALSDRGLPRVTTNIVIACICGALYVPTFLAFSTRSVVACWLLQGLHLALTAWAMGVLPAIVSRIYPAGVRISGFNLGHNFGATVGGVTPLIITAIQASTGAVFLGPGVFMTFMALTSVLGSLALIKYYPATNTVP